MKKGEITNKSLIILLVGAMIVSLGGTFISLSRLGKIGTPYVTGHAQTETGSARITIASMLSINVIDDSVDYGTCWPPSSGYVWMDSNDAGLYSLTQSPGKCNSVSIPDVLEVFNDGNIAANVTIKTNDNKIVSDPTNNNGSLWFYTQNASTDPGCYGTHETWTNFTSTNTDYAACDNLSQNSNWNRFEIAFRVYTDASATAGSQTATITFTANTIES